ncbi:MAG: polymer-forming cytoskeletal protein [Heliobacteriaceae bacterium]|nr:polymer-forming cytoskeletal protein [Heliobacteriaceae bacterium]
MFGLKRKMAGNSERVDTVIGPDTSFTGTIQAAGSIRIDGQFNGEIRGQGDIIIGENGRVEANIEGRNVVIAGSVEGNITAGGRLELATTGKLYGDLVAGSLVVDEGAVFLGASRAEPRSGTVDEEESPAPSVAI